MASGRGRAYATFVSSVAIAASSIGSISGSSMAGSNSERAATTAPPPPQPQLQILAGRMTAAFPALVLRLLNP
jgi:hypothetical protein